MSTISTTQTNSSDAQSPFENIKHTDENQSEFWYARELQIMLGYKRWEDFYKLIERTKNVDFDSKPDHIRFVPKKVILGSKAEREIDDYELTRYACYLIAMNGDSRKPQIAFAQDYFYSEKLNFEKGSGFDDFRHSNKNLSEFWYARELQIMLGYKFWQDFNNLIERTKNLDFEGKDYHIRYEPKKVNLGSGAERLVSDYILTKFGTYKIAMLGSTKECINARSYFAIQTIKQEINEQLSKDQKRVEIRGQVTKHNKKLFETAKEAGVHNFGEFNDQGYLGLYGMRNKQIIKKKNLGKDGILDRSGATELAANLFRITQTEEKLRSDNVSTQTKSEKIHNMVGGKIRQTIKDIGGTLPEELQPEKHIKEVKKEIKKLTNKKPLKTLK